MQISIDIYILQIFQYFENSSLNDSYIVIGVNIEYIVNILCRKEATCRCMSALYICVNQKVKT
jgi:hypothetical protein